MLLGRGALRLEGSRSLRTAPFPSRTLLLGTTAKYVFLYLPAEKKTYVVPIDNLSRLVVSSEKPRPARPAGPP